jgi:hypothetical protein
MPPAATATGLNTALLHLLLLWLPLLQEAAYICRGGEGAKAIMNMGVAAQDGLWAAVEAGDGPAFRYQLAQLKLMPTQVGCSDENRGTTPHRMQSGVFCGWVHTVA